MTLPEAEKREGGISGPALYDGRFDAAEALEVLADESGLSDCFRD
ncbi:hypothetical protein [Jiella marina]|nr:hypothetical protein [Jiella sp. LLJ827]